jgi:signal transduction histidine kinase/DNA-binding response OmpR family regulator
VRIVVADDVAENRYFLEALLRGHGYEVTSARNGQEALAELERAGADLAISDILMPVMDGYQLCRAMKADAKLASIPVVFYTATYTSDGDRDFALGLGASRFIVKPTEPDAFIGIIRDVLAEAEGGRLDVTAPVVSRDLTFDREHDLRVTRKLEKKIEELEAARKLLQDVFQSMGEGLAVIGPDFRIRMANPAYRALAGLAASDLAGMSCFEATTCGRSPCDDPACGCPVRESFSTGGPALGRHTHATPARATVETEVRSYPIKAASGEVTAVIEIIRDVTEERRAEELHRQLEQAQKMEAVGRLAGGIAHDFNNLLTVILGRANIALGVSSIPDAVRGEVEEIQTAAERAAALTSQLLIFSRKQALKPRLVDLGEVVEGVGKILRRLIGEDIEVVTVLSPDLPAVRVDPGQMEQVILNLGVNARDAMPHGGRLTIETAEVSLDEEYVAVHAGAASGPHVMLAVSDTGVGMDVETKARIFDPFFTTKDPGKGTGLGLSVVHGIVQQSGGSIWVYSEPGKGTTFKVYLPSVPQRAGPRSDVKPVVVPRGDETILLVEDEAAVRRLAAAVLRESGYAVLEAGSGDEALGLLSKTPGPLHLLLTDFVMPRMTGRELAERAREGRPGLRVLFMSGYTDTGFANHAESEPFDFLQKPFTRPALAQKVREVLDRR